MRFKNIKAGGTISVTSNRLPVKLSLNDHADLEITDQVKELMKQGILSPCDGSGKVLSNEEAMEALSDKEKESLGIPATEPAPAPEAPAATEPEPAPAPETPAATEPEPAPAPETPAATETTTETTHKKSKK